MTSFLFGPKMTLLNSHFKKKKKKIGSGTRRVPSGRVKRVPVETNGAGQ
jgi:hypothetical protein